MTANSSIPRIGKQIEAATVIILTFNQREATIACLRSLKAINSPGFDILVWDNGSEDGTAAAISQAFADVQVHYHPVNLGVASGRNAAASEASRLFAPEYFLFLDNDMIVEPGFVSALLEPFRRDEKVGQTQAKLRFMNDRGRLNDGGGCQINFLLGTTRPIGFGELDQGQYDEVRPCISCGGAMMVRASVFELLNGFDTIFDPFGPEDLDFSLRLSQAGYKSLYVPHAVAYHAVSHTFGANYDANYARHKTRHWFLLMKRHAPRWERIIFLFTIAPWLLVKVLVRESLRGNVGVLRGLLRGALDAAKARS